MLYRLEQAYSYGDELSWDELPSSYSRLDTNEDSFLSTEELSHITMLPADATLQIEFVSGDSPLLNVEAPLASPLHAIRCRPTLWRLDDQQNSLHVRLEDRLSPGQAGTAATVLDFALTSIRLLVSLEETSTDLFASIDTNESGWLDTSELAAAKFLLANQDRNGDEQVTPAELESAKRLFLRRATLAPVPGESPTIMSDGNVASSNTPNWFVQMDTNRDGLVQSLEFLGSREMFANLDSNRDGQLDADEIEQLADNASTD